MWKTKSVSSLLISSIQDLNGGAKLFEMKGDFTPPSGRMLNHTPTTIQ
jgi:hypothetical protein